MRPLLACLYKRTQLDNLVGNLLKKSIIFNIIIIIRQRAYLGTSQEVAEIKTHFQIKTFPSILFPGFQAPPPLR